MLDEVFKIRMERGIVRVVTRVGQEWFNQRVRSSNQVDERLCVYCFKVRNDLSVLLLDEEDLCSDCRDFLQKLCGSYRVDGVLYHVLYVYNDFLQSFFSI